MNQLGAETVDHADRVCAIGIQQCRVVRHDWQILVDEQTFINNIDFKTAGSQTIVFVFEFLRRADYCWITFLFKELFKKLKLLLSWHSGKINYCYRRRTLRLATDKLFI